MPNSTIVEVVPTGEVDNYREEARQAIFNLENVDEALKAAPTNEGRVQMSRSEWTGITCLAQDARTDAARLRELADSIEHRVRAAETVDG